MGDTMGDAFQHPDFPQIRGLDDALEKIGLTQEKIEVDGRTVTIFYPKPRSKGLSKEQLLKHIMTKQEDVVADMAAQAALQQFKESIESLRESTQSPKASLQGKGAEVSPRTSSTRGSVERVVTGIGWEKDVNEAEEKLYDTLSTGESVVADMAAQAALQQFKESIESPRESIQSPKTSLQGRGGEVSPRTSSTRGSVERVVTGIGWEKDVNEAEEKLYDTLSKGESFEKAYNGLEKGLKTKLTEKLRANNNMFKRGLQWLADLLGIKTNIGYSSRHLSLALQQQSIEIENVNFIIREHLYGRVDEDLVKTILALPKDEQNAIFLELFKSCIERTPELGGPDLVSLDTLMDTLISLPGGVDSAEEVLGGYLQYSPHSSNPLSHASEEVKKCVDQITKRLGAAQEKKAKFLHEILTDPNEKTIEALRNVKGDYYDLTTLGEVKRTGVCVNTIPKDLFLGRVCEAIIEKYKNSEDNDLKMCEQLKLLLRDQMDSDPHCARQLIDSLGMRRDRSLHQKNVIATCHLIKEEFKRRTKGP